MSSTPQARDRRRVLAGVEPAAEASFRDHHPYNDRDVSELLALRAQSEGDGFVTTEKDCVNLGPLAGKLQPLVTVAVRMKLENADGALDHMLAILRQRRDRHSFVHP